MSKFLKLGLAGLLVLSAVLTYVLTRPTTPTAAWDGSAHLSRAEKALEGLPSKEAEALRALLVSTGPRRYDDLAGAWFKSALKEDLRAVSDYAVVRLRAMAEAGDTEAMWHLHFVLTQRIATGDEGFRWLAKAAKLGHPRSVFDQVSLDLRDRPTELAAAMNDFARREDAAGFQALRWLAGAHEKGDHGFPKDAAKARGYRARAKDLGEKLFPPLPQK